MVRSEICFPVDSCVLLHHNRGATVQVSAVLVINGSSTAAQLRCSTQQVVVLAVSCVWSVASPHMYRIIALDETTHWRKTDHYTFEKRRAMSRNLLTTARAYGSQN
jgi:hypothetical protein